MAPVITIKWKDHVPPPQSVIRVILCLIQGFQADCAELTLLFDRLDATPPVPPRCIKTTFPRSQTSKPPAQDLLTHGIQYGLPAIITGRCGALQVSYRGMSVGAADDAESGFGNDETVYNLGRRHLRQQTERDASPATRPARIPLSWLSVFNTCFIIRGSQAAERREASSDADQPELGNTSVLHSMHISYSFCCDTSYTINI